MSKIGIQSSKKHPSNFPILNFCIWKPGCFPFIPWYIPFIKTHSYWVRWEPHQLSPLHRGHSERLFQELAPTFALVQRRIGKDSQGVPAVRQGSFSGWRRSWQTRKFSTNWEYSNPKPDWSWKETGLARPYPFIPKTCPPFIIGVSIDTYFAHCSAGR